MKQDPRRRLVQFCSKAPVSIGYGLHMEAIYRDFTFNALSYDPFNRVVIDPTGRGVEDAINKFLRIPVIDAKINLWFDGIFESAPFVEEYLINFV